MVWECGLSDCGAGYRQVAGTCEHGSEVSGVEFPDQQRITFQDCVHRRVLERSFRVRILRKESAGSEGRKPASVSESSPPTRSITICHAAIFVTVWRMTGRLSTKNRQWRRVYNSSRERGFANSPSNEKTLNADMSNVTSGSSAPNHCLRVQALQPGDAAARNRSLSLDRGIVLAMKTHFVLWPELTRMT
jgi:hypothetical protein